MGVMTATAHEPRSSRDATLLEAVRASRQREIAEQVRQVELVVDWCADHEVAEADAATIVEHGRDTGLTLAGPGGPSMSEFALIGLAARYARRCLPPVRRAGPGGPLPAAAAVGTGGRW